MKVLYIGQSSISSTSFHRAKALERIGAQVEILNPYVVTDNLFSISFKVHYRTGYRFLQKRIKNWLAQNIKNQEYDLVWVNSGELLGAECISFLRSKTNKPVILYNNDDPTGGRDGRRFDSLLKAIPIYDACIVMREFNIKEYYNLGAKKVIRTFMSFDEVEHQPLKSKIPDKFKSEVCFIGTNIPNEKRDLFIYELTKRGVPISIWGSRWERSTYWKELRPFFKGPSLKGDDYIAAIQGAKICLGLLSKGNRDLHTTRTFEIPYIGSLLCAERTQEHLALFKENEEAIFWEDVDECAVKCLKLLNDSDTIKTIAENGRNRILNDGRGNEDVLKKILKETNNEI
ncbi:glycosyltransferase family 1 protein [Zobellia amurskyensis]|uniref:Glycosyltransferase family 1 protein n=1 Tax=Zobellia amurskyensis TaxID=248905 RepID=A0A7X2ZSM4_9FLAO|nr:glycosyltransferase [Zobellia amurskyensis]MUH35594.1 glycosyltransferase family 1 protein [Zobellia amurskyensis]